MTLDVTENTSGLWLSIADIARRKGVSRQAIAERVAKFEDAGQIATQQGPRGTKLVNFAEFDRVADDQTSFSKQEGARTKGASKRGAYNAAIAERAEYEAELKRLDLAERTGKLVSVSAVETAAADAAASIVWVVESLNNRADDIEVARGGNNLRILLRKIVFDMRTQIAAALRKMAEDASSSHGSAPATTIQQTLDLPAGGANQALP